MASALSVLAVLVFWWVLQVWVLPRLGVPTWAVPQPPRRGDRTDAREKSTERWWRTSAVRLCWRWRDQRRNHDGGDDDSDRM